MAAPRKPFDAPSPEQSAFLERAIEQYGKATYNFAYRLTHNEADARDLTQDAFIRVYRAWRSFKPGTSFLSWIYRIVTNLYRDELRRRKGRYQEEIPEDNAPQDWWGAPAGHRLRSTTSRGAPQRAGLQSSRRRSHPNSGKSWSSRTWRSTATKRLPKSSAARSGRSGRDFTAQRPTPQTRPTVYEVVIMNEQHLSPETLLDFLHGELPEGEDASVHAHLAECRERSVRCRGLLNGADPRALPRPGARPSARRRLAHPRRGCGLARPLVAPPDGDAAAAHRRYRHRRRFVIRHLLEPAYLALTRASVDDRRRLLSRRPLVPRPDDAFW